VPVHVAAVCDAGHQHHAGAVVDRVDDAIVAYADAIVVLAGELHVAWRARVIGECIDRGANPILQGSVEPTVGLGRLTMQPDVVAGAYSRTSDHGIAWSASSRA
jgi:hypothetical protein